MHYGVTSHSIEKLKQTQTKITNDALNELISRLPVDTSVIDHQLNKISCYPDEVTIDVVESLILKPIEENVFLLSESILNKKFHKAYSIYKDMIALSYDPIYLIAVISSILLITRFNKIKHMGILFFVTGMLTNFFDFLTIAEPYR